MSQTFTKVYNLVKMKRFMRKIHSGVMDSACSSLTSQSEYLRDRVFLAPCISNVVSYSTNVRGYKRGLSVVPFRTCSLNILPGISMRRYCTRHDDNFPRLTRLKCRGYPSTLASFSNFFLTYLVIKPHLDKSFSANEFLYTSKKVVGMVSSRIAESDFEALKDLVTADVLEEIKINLPKFSVSQRRDLAISDEELVYSFLDTISLDVDNENNTKSLEILTIHHAFKGIDEVKKLAENFNPFDIETVQKKILESKPQPFILNYRFLRKFHSTGEADDWIINGVQHQSGKSVKIGNFF